MPTNVIHTLRYNDPMFGDSKVVGHSTTDVPSISDLDSKVGKTDFNTLATSVEDISNLLNTTVESLNNAITSLNNKADKADLSNVLSQTYLNQVKQEFANILKAHIDVIQKECKKQHVILQNDIKSFSKLGDKANTELSSKFKPIDDAIKEFNLKIDYFTRTLGELEIIEKRITSAHFEIDKIHKEVDILIDKAIQERIHMVVDRRFNLLSKQISDIEREQKRKKGFFERLFGR
ncbi:MAG: hypothetical protein R3Y59_09540 [bacterium]